MADWIEPKTDWTSNDYVNTVDYNRIIGNLAYLKAFADELFKSFDILSMGEEKAYLSLIYAREMNIIETNLETINTNTYVFDIGNTMEYKDNGKTPLYTEYNRIESACLLLYTALTSHKEALPKLAFTLGGEKGIRV